MSNTERTAMSDERKAKLRAGRLRGEAQARAMKHDLILGRLALIDSPEFRAKHRSNSVINKAFAIVDAERIKFKLNADGSPMSIDDEIDFRRSRGIKLLKHHYEHLGVEAPAKGKASAEPVTAEEVEEISQFLTEEERAELESLVA